MRISDWSSDVCSSDLTFGFTNMLVKLLRESDADAIAVIFDASAKTFRNDIYPAYKAHRPEPPEDLVPQFAAIREATRAFNLPCVELAGYEADDLIATYARQATAAGADRKSTRLNYRHSCASRMLSPA